MFLRNETSAKFVFVSYVSIFLCFNFDPISALFYLASCPVLCSLCQYYAKRCGVLRVLILGSKGGANVHSYLLLSIAYTSQLS